MEEPLLATEANPTTEGQTAETNDNSLLSEETTQQVETKEQGAPESYDFKTPEELPEGAEIDGQILTAYSEAAKEANLPQDKAQGVLDKVMTAMHKHGLEAAETQRNEWADQARKDPEYGGKQLDENLGIAKKALEKFGSEPLQDLLEGPQGLGNHPELIRFMVKVGKAIGEDGYVGSNQGKSVDLDDVATQARRLYPSSNT